MLFKHMDKYIESCRDTLEAMFSIHLNANQPDYAVELTKQFIPSNDTCVHIPFFGSISGEFFFSVNLDDWKFSVKQTLGMDDEELVFSSLKEFLNIVTGDTMTSISKEFPNLTYLSPRITIGKMNYPSVKSIATKMQMETLSVFELAISIDCMKIDLNEKLIQSRNEVDVQLKQLRSSERMTVLGSLVENVLQDLKDPVISLDKGLNEIKELSLENKPPFPEKLNTLLESVKRIKNIAGTLVNFTNATSHAVSEFNLVDCASKAVKISNYSYPNDVQIKIIPPEKPIPPIKSNPRQVEQVIFNLIVNSFEALENTAQPVITIESFSENSYCGYHISHNGKNVMSEVKMWEPIFSRNKSGNITSLGLTVCREILQMYGGDILFEHEKGEDSTFTVILPVK